MRRHLELFESTGDTKMTNNLIPEMFGLCYEKERIEARLGKGIYDVFNSGAALTKLQRVGGVILGLMADATFVGVQSHVP